MDKYLVLDELDELMYLTTLDGYELRFMNKPLRKLTNALGDSYVGKKCYEYILGRTTPCDFCQKNLLKKNKFVMRKYYVNKYEKYYLWKAKVSSFQNENYRLVIVDDISHAEEQTNAIKRIGISENMIYNFIDEIASGVDVKKAIDELLFDVCQYYQADRAYIFSIDNINKTLSNTHEYAANGVMPQIDMLQNLPISSIDRWIEPFKRDGKIFIDSVGNELDKNSDEYKILEAQEIERLVAFPFYIEDELVGFIGIDNPKNDYKDATILKSISFFAFYEINKEINYRRLDFLSHFDVLTGLKNRNSYIHEIESLKDMNVDNLGVIYIDLNGLKEANDKYGHEYGDELITHTARIILEFYRENSYRVGGDEFVIILSNISSEKFNEGVNILKEAFNKDDKVSISLGSIYQPHPEDIEATISEADRQMYIEKKKFYDSKA